MNKKQSCEESVEKCPTQASSECWFDDACILDMDYFVKTLSAIKQKGVRADLIGSIITHYASKWLPDLSAGDDDDDDDDVVVAEKGFNQFQESPESVTTSWMKKRFFVETLVGVLPPEKDSIPCNFLLRLLRTANMVGVEATYRAELEKRISWQLDQASLKELMIPSFSHTCGTLLDVELVIRLVTRFVSLDHEGVKSGSALVKVAKLIDCYLAEAAVDANLSLSEFVALAGALPSHARATDDGLYRAIDTYLKAHSCVSKQERKGLCRLIDSRKLTPEASLHAAQNERLPVRAVIQVLFSEQTKLNRHIDWSGSFSGLRSPNGWFDPQTTRCLSKREMNAQQMEIRKLKEDVYRLQSQCNAMQVQMERMVEKKKGFFKWKRFGMPAFSKSLGGVERMVEEAEKEVGFGRQTPMDMKTSLVKDRTPHKWRKSMSRKRGCELQI
ncbi:root phototropism protein 3-like [Gastrolobium bilobum]|uniref:root phototropism protein 3-like n=1 Tax=Gastrolobium bilobum TaxID=150636 RepID=UPI002AB0C09E|nr:root phototropism protein 3-like [Gastrolobium bilobum]